MLKSSTRKKEEKKKRRRKKRKKKMVTKYGWQYEAEPTASLVLSLGSEKLMLTIILFHL